MHKSDPNRVIFFSKEDLSGSRQLEKGEPILRADLPCIHSDINEVLELYNIKKYIDNDLFLIGWSPEDKENFKLKVDEFAKIIGQFMASLEQSNFDDFYEAVILEYRESFWELVNNQSVFKRISKDSFKNVLKSDPHLICTLLKHRKLVSFFDSELRDFLLTYTHSTEILLSVYEVEHTFENAKLFIPKSLTLEDKEGIVSKYLDSDKFNLNYLKIIQNASNGDFKISDKIRLKSKRLHDSEIAKFFANQGGRPFGVNIGFPEKMTKIKEGFVDDDQILNYSYSLDFIKENDSPHLLLHNFRILFEFVDVQGRINLVSKKSELGTLEQVIGVRGYKEYVTGTSFTLKEMTALLQVVGYSKVVNQLDTSLEELIESIFNNLLHEKYQFPENAKFTAPNASSSFLEKVRSIAPELESMLKQFKLFVEEGNIDFELLQMSSKPSSIKDIPSLNENKYVYLNEENEVITACSNLFFSDQSMLSYVEPFRDKQYSTFFELLASEQVKFGYYEDYQKPRIEYLINNGLIAINDEDFITVPNENRIIILRDLYMNEVASFYHYSPDFQKEVEQMESEDMLSRTSSLFSKAEQSYFNYHLNKSEFTNGLDLRNKYLHGTQARPEEKAKHENAYVRYLKLIFLTLLKIEDDLIIFNMKNELLTSK